MRGHLQSHHGQHHHQEQHPSVFVDSVSPSAQLYPGQSPSENASPEPPTHEGGGLIFLDPSAQFAAPTASPDDSVYLSFDCGAASLDWDISGSGRASDPRDGGGHPVVKVEAAEMMDLLDYSLAAFNQPSDSLSPYQDAFDKVFDKVKVDLAGNMEDVYDDDDDDDDVDQDFKQQLLMNNVNGHTVIVSAVTFQRVSEYMVAKGISGYE